MAEVEFKPFPQFAGKVAEKYVTFPEIHGVIAENRRFIENVLPEPEK